MPHWPDPAARLLDGERWTRAAFEKYVMPSSPFVSVQEDKGCLVVARTDGTQAWLPLHNILDNMKMNHEWIDAVIIPSYRLFTAFCDSTHMM